MRNRQIRPQYSPTRVQRRRRPPAGIGSGWRSITDPIPCGMDVLYACGGRIGGAIHHLPSGRFRASRYIGGRCEVGVYASQAEAAGALYALAADAIGGDARG